MKEWFKDWFASDEYLEVYRHRNNEDAQRLFELIIGNIKTNTPMKVLDIACGTGRHSLLFAQKGFNVTGFDLSLNLLRLAKAKSEKSGCKIDLFSADIRCLVLKKQFDLIINLFTSFGYFETDEENFLLFKDAFNYLKKGGYFIFDYFNVEYLKKNLVPESEEKMDDKLVIQKRYIEKGRVIKDIIIKSAHLNRIYKESVKLYDSEDIITRLEEEGFCIKKIFGNYLGDPFNKYSSKRTIIIAQR